MINIFGIFPRGNFQSQSITEGLRFDAINRRIQGELKTLLEELRKEVAGLITCPRMIFIMNP